MIGHRRPLADPTHQLDSVAVGEAEVEEHGVGVLGGRRCRTPSATDAGLAAPGSPRRPARRAGSGASAARPRPPARRARVGHGALLRTGEPGSTSASAGTGGEAPAPGDCSRKERAAPGSRCARRNAPSVDLGDGPGDGEPEPRSLPAWPSRAWWKRSKTCSSSPGATPGPRSPTSDRARLARRRGTDHAPRCPAACVARRSRASSRGAAPAGCGSTDDQAAAESGSRCGRWCGRAFAPSARAPRRPARPPGPTPARGETAPEASRVMSSRFFDEALHPLGLLGRWSRTQLAPAWARPTSWSRQRGGRAGDGRERRAEVVRHRREQRAAQRLRLGTDRGLAGPVGEGTHEEADPEHHREGEEVPWIGDVQRVGRRHEEEVVGEDPHGRGRNRWSAPEEDCRDEHHEDVEHLDVRHVEHRARGRADGRRSDDERHRGRVPEPPGLEALVAAKRSGSGADHFRIRPRPLRPSRGAHGRGPTWPARNGKRPLGASSSSALSARRSRGSTDPAHAGGDCESVVFCDGSAISSSSVVKRVS